MPTTTESQAGEAHGFGSRLPALGPHGEGWVALQGVLLVIEGLCSWRGPRWPRRARLVRLFLGAALFAGGAALFAGGSRRLGRQLTPFPHPVADGELRRDGAYGLVRHPIYGGVVLIATAWALVTSPLALLPAALTVPFFDLKRCREEAWLVARHEGYEDYRGEVRHRFIPFVW
jgi:protein-S-isoprenylcysteine O-methyltransferase Ste14